MTTSVPTATEQSITLQEITLENGSDATIIRRDYTPTPNFLRTKKQLRYYIGELLSDQMQSQSTIRELLGKNRTISIEIKRMEIENQNLKDIILRMTIDKYGN